MARSTTSVVSTSSQLAGTYTASLHCLLGLGGHFLAGQSGRSPSSSNNSRALCPRRPELELQLSAQCSGGRYLKFLNSSFPAAGLVWLTLLHPEEKREFELELQLSAQCSGGRYLKFLNSSFPAAGLVWLTLLHPEENRSSQVQQAAW